MKKIIARLWRSIRGPAQWRILWFAHAKFMVGVTGVVRDDEGRVLLLKHRMWAPERPWGLPTGYALKGEEFPRTVVREVKEETGLDVEAGRLVRLKSGYRLRVEVAYEARLVGGSLRLDAFEILEARWFFPDALPEGLQEAHRALIHGGTGGRTGA
ncbi:NUDIX domain-containing protein [Streptomyces sp. NPDC003077]|uniref:NUDIX domain-containing protein n=1 Tax=Streptomyces sp. NPDC003077 TaxID=3154443 RepID=UPI0033B234E0